MSFSVAAGEVFCLLGPNGAGKTTTTEILEGYRARSADEVRVLGQDPERGERALRERVGIVLQEAAAQDELTVAEVLTMFGACYPRRRPVDELTALVGLEGKEADRVKRLSGGQKRRIEVVAQVARGDEVLEAARRTRPDVALLDIEMPGVDGLEAAGQLARRVPEAHALMLTTFGRPGYLRRAMEQGVAGFLLKDAPAEDLARAICVARRGERVVDPGLAAAALSEGPSPLTPREHDVLAAAASTRRSPTSRRPYNCRPAPCATTCRPRSARRARATSRSDPGGRGEGLALSPDVYHQGEKRPPPPSTQGDR